MCYDLNCRFILSDEVKEYQFQYMWSKVFCGTTFKSISGICVKVINPGVWNKEEGPDFKDAVIEIDGAEKRGDVELHLYSGAWKQHGHHKDKNYSNVILHVVRKYKYSDLDKNMITLELPDGFISEFSTNGKDKYPRGFCIELFKALTDEKVHRLFVCAGVERLKNKACKAVDDILTHGADKALLIGLFDAAGYKKNREQFLLLLERLLKYELNYLSEKEINAVLWGESGLLPDPTQYKCEDNLMSEFINQTWAIWWKLRKSDRKQIKWNLSGVRPQNNPCRRIAALQILIGRFGIENSFSSLIKLLTKQNGKRKYWTEFKENLICRDEIWDNYSSYKALLKCKNAVLGEMRALDIFGNIILPLVYAYGMINKDSELLERVEGIFVNLPQGQNNIIIEMSSERWLIPKERVKIVSKSFAARQGIIYLYKNYCEALSMNCRNCEVYKNLPI